MARKKRQAQNSKVRHLITNLNPRSPISEQHRTIRTNLQFSAIDSDLQTVLLTSAGPAEGKSMTTANLAVVYAQQNKKVLLIDADLRKPTVHYTFRLSNLTGLTNILVGETPMHDAISQTGIMNLDAISSGPIPPNPSELLGSARMDMLLNQARQTYDVIIFDTPPVLAVADAQILSGKCDGTILVVRSKQTEYDAAARAIELLQASNTKVLGTILNDQDAKQSNYYYYYGTK